MKKIFILHENSFVLFIEKVAPILILGSIFLIIFDKFEIAFELKDTVFSFLIVILALFRAIFVLTNNKCIVTITDKSLTILKGNKLPKTYKFEDIENLSYMYYGIYNHSDKREKGFWFDEIIKDADAVQHSLRNPMEDYFFSKARIQQVIKELV